MNRADEVVAAARRRARFLVRGDADSLGAILHEEFAWTSHLGHVLSREEYVRGNIGSDLVWLSQTLHEVDVTVVGEVAVLRCVAEDRVVRHDVEMTLRMPVTQTWVQVDKTWLCLAGHAGPLEPQPVGS